MMNDVKYLISAMHTKLLTITYSVSLPLLLCQLHFFFLTVRHNNILVHIDKGAIVVLNAQTHI